LTPDQKQDEPDRQDGEDQPDAYADGDAEGSTTETDANLTSTTVNDFVVVTKSDVEPSKESVAEQTSRRQQNDGYTW
jgi:hypothetical protein